jgi:glycogen debranching enzyme
MTEGWGFQGAARPAAAGNVILIQGVTFCICDRAGDMLPGAEQGLFFRDTRFLSRFRLEVNDAPCDPLAVHCPAPYSARFVTRRPPRPGRADSTLLVVRRRYVGNGMREDITVRNLGREPAAVLVTLSVDTDFADLFAVKEGRARARGEIARTGGDGQLRMAYQAGAASAPGAVGNRAVTVTADGDPVPGEEGLAWHPVISPRAEWTVTVEVTVRVNGEDVPGSYQPGQPVERAAPAAALASWRESMPRLATPDPQLTALLAGSGEDLGALRIFDPERPGRPVIAAGAPWFMTLFGRDSLLTSWMLLPLDPSLALGTLQTLAQHQGRKQNPLTEEEPGRILHEIRSGLDAERALGGRSIYYGTVDATPLFVMLLGELHRWGAPASEIDPLLPHADRALEWIETHGDRDRDGFVEYQRATDQGLVNQGWKDSFDAISFAAGQLAEPPIALAEVQGYVYGAYLARAQIAAARGDRERARYCAARAAALKHQFNQAFWLADRGYYALALDGGKRPVDALASNMGHCLWTGIVAEEKAATVAAWLLSPEMFTGFGIRTLASSMAAYNPMSYHNGSVWPHDNAIAAAGLRRYGQTAAAQQVAVAMFDAATLLGGRLPELFCGFDRAEFGEPVPYPTACSPQAWAVASPLLLLRALLGFDPLVPAGRVWCAPAVPDRYLPMRVEHLQLAGARMSCEISRDGWRLEGLPPGLQLRPEPAGLSVFSAGIDRLLPGKSSDGQDVT